MNFSAGDRLSVEHMIAYLEGRLTPEAEAAVDRLLREQPAYVEAMAELEKAMKQDPQAAARALEAERHLAAALPAWAARRAPAKVSILNTPTWMRAVAGVSLFAVASALLITQLQPPHERLARQYMASYAELSLKGEGASEWEDAIRLYADEKHEQAAEAFAALAAADPALQENDAFLLYQGSAWALAREYARAIPALERLAASPDPAYRDAAAWYLAWAYLGTDSLPAAKQRFAELAARPNPFMEKAAEVLRKLD
jgi:hypothetical protein